MEAIAAYPGEAHFGMNGLEEAHSGGLAVDLEAGPLAPEVDEELALLEAFLREVGEPLGS